ncbi:anti-sigma factor family protein [Streptomyces sp. NPDC048219]|uniref:anti-sigma factor family protein n=1 Tax=unclassified Streptomyces TaxID=2593676 RepID=UPI0034324F66
MTSSTTDTAGHPDVAEISDLAEGLLTPSRTTDVRRHLESCELCADVHASLEEIQGLLGTLPGPQRMPDDVAGRIDAALAAEARLGATAPAVSAAAAAEGDEDHADTHVSRETSAADRPSGHARTATRGPGRKNRRRIGRRRIAVLGAVAAAAALGIGSVIVSSVTGGSPPEDTAHGPQTAPVDTFSESRLQKQVTELVGDGQGARSGSRTPHSFGTSSETENHVLTQPTIVPECVQKAIGRDDAVLATEEGVYKGKEALLVVLPDALNDNRVTAYIVDSACVEQPAVGKATVLLEHSYTRP